jgi:hypothetical protein
VTISAEVFETTISCERYPGHFCRECLSLALTSSSFSPMNNKHFTITDQNPVINKSEAIQTSKFKKKNLQDISGMYHP